MQRKLTWLHLSDIHFRPKTEWREIAARDALLKFLAEQFKDNTLPKPDLIFCTGDIAFGETKNATLTQQYGYANDFFEQLARTCSIKKKCIFLVPGNHDVDRTTVNADAQTALNDKAANSRNHEAEINQRFEDKTLEQLDAFKRLTPYGTFVEQQFKHHHDPDGRHVYGVCTDVNGLTVGIGGFNSAWSCSGPEDDRHIWLAAEWQFNIVKTKLQEADLRIGLMHHPVDCLNEAERDISTRRIANDFHFWLHGHTHNAWVKPEASCVTIAAGAVGAEQDDEFGINLVELDLEGNTGQVHLFRYSIRDNGWTISPVPTQAPRGIWSIVPPTVPERTSTPVGATHQLHITADNEASALPAPLRSATNSKKIYGREVLIRSLVEKSQVNTTLAIYGMRGNGKSELIQELLKQPPFHCMGQPLRITVHGEYRAADLFRQLAPMLGDTSEYPTPPTGNTETIARALKERYPSVRRVCIWIDKAHLLFNANGWGNAELGKLFLACNQAFSDRLHWFFELREKLPQTGLLGNSCHREEVPGLDQTSLSQCLKEAAPAGKENDWTYTGKDLKKLYQWLGGGQGEQAHPLATRLLIEVALGKQLKPLEALSKLQREAQQRLEDALLFDLYRSVLSDQECQLLQALSLYREPIPHDHADRLEAALNVTGAWARLDQRCLLPSDPMQQFFYLHGFIAEWVSDQLDQTKREGLHAMVADAWLCDLNGSTRISQPNIQRATEAFHHLIQAQQHQRLDEISSNLFGPNKDWVCKQLWAYDERLFEQKAAIQSQQQVLSLITRIVPEDHKAWRFLGEVTRLLEGGRSESGLKYLRQAYKLDPSYSKYLSNLGDALLDQGKNGAEEFLCIRLNAEHNYPETTKTDYVVSIHAKALDLVGRSGEAAGIRQSKIQQNSINPVFYTAEADHLVSAGDISAAKLLLVKAKKLGASLEHVAAIENRIKQKK